MKYFKDFTKWLMMRIGIRIKHKHTHIVWMPCYAGNRRVMLFSNKLTNPPEGKGRIRNNNTKVSEHDYQVEIIASRTE